MALTFMLSPRIIDDMNETRSIDTAGLTYISVGALNKWMFETYKAKPANSCSMNYIFEDTDLYVEFCLKWL